MTRQLAQIGIAIDQNALEPPLEHMPVAPVAPVRCLGVDAISMPHPLRRVPRHRLGQERVVIRHQAVRVADPVVPLCHLPKRRQEALPILIVLTARLAPVTTGGEVVQRAGKLDA